MPESFISCTAHHSCAVLQEGRDQIRVLQSYGQLTSLMLHAIRRVCQSVISHLTRSTVFLTPFCIPLPPP